EARAVDRVGHGVAARQLVADAPPAVRRRVGLAREPGRRLEDAMEVEVAEARGVRSGFEARHLLGRLAQLAPPRHRSGARLDEARLRERLRSGAATELG